ncbi:PLDc N-terminal domain-containing protein [Limnochorda pilosa]|uniref:Cardiolipin synthase N-terminal domain-containing protein n=1 Tax=Limnochorda pilosa TaxID=1555112 RepID=A0A0K2SI81_LIMPI|nr:PLDc N-terminal domain-containing protein [Limnochorda pilosa]BAS26722.1 hypothetical protein LIP_0865 [Limnochorda pilosa]
MEILRLLWPLVVVELLLKAYALQDLAKQEPRAVRWHTRWVWALVILLVSTLGPLGYLLWGKVESA